VNFLYEAILTLTKRLEVIDHKLGGLITDLIKTYMACIDCIEVISSVLKILRILYYKVQMARFFQGCWF
jgi:hypothetical protein